MKLVKPERVVRCGLPSLPSPMPRRTTTSLPSSDATSCEPSWLKSAIAKRVEDVPMGYLVVLKVGNVLAADAELERTVRSSVDNDRKDKERRSGYMPASPKLAI